MLSPRGGNRARDRRQRLLLPTLYKFIAVRKDTSQMIHERNIHLVCTCTCQTIQEARTPRRSRRGGISTSARRTQTWGEILTPEELAQRLKVSVAWITEKRRPRCPNPIPALPIGKQIRFDWDSVVKWLEDCAAADAKSLRERRTKHKPQRRKPSKNLIALPNLENEETDETTPSKRKHRQA